MATIPSIEELARLVLKVMVFGEKVRAGQGLPVGAAKAASEKEGINSQEFEDGLKYAAKEGWVTYRGTFVTLTDIGFAAAPNVPVDRHGALREIAELAREVAALIRQPGHLDAGQFQSQVGEMQGHGPDVELRGIQGQLSAVAASIEAYLRDRAV